MLTDSKTALVAVTLGGSPGDPRPARLAEHRLRSIRTAYRVLCLIFSHSSSNSGDNIYCFRSLTWRCLRAFGRLRGSPSRPDSSSIRPEGSPRNARSSHLPRPSDVHLLVPLTRSPSWFTASRTPRPISCRFFISEAVWLSVQIWNTFGLSQPSRSAECEKMKGDRLLKRQQPLLVPHDQIVGVLVSLRIRPSRYPPEDRALVRFVRAK